MIIDKNMIIPYASERFNCHASEYFKTWEKSKKIKIAEAFKIHYKYALQNIKKIDKKKFKGYPLTYCYDNYYVFSTVMNMHKSPKFNLTGVWVNAETGEAKFIRIDREQDFHKDRVRCEYIGNLNNFKDKN